MCRGCSCTRQVIRRSRCRSAEFPPHEHWQRIPLFFTSQTTTFLSDAPRNGGEYVQTYRTSSFVGVTTDSAYDPCGIPSSCLGELTSGANVFTLSFRVDTEMPGITPADLPLFARVRMVGPENSTGWSAWDEMTLTP